MQLYACTSRYFGLGLVASGLLTLPALAGTPEALDHVPASSQAVVVVPNLGTLLNDIDGINAFMGDMGRPEVVAVTSMIRGRPGINLDGSLAAVLQFEVGQDEPDMVYLVPVSDFETFTQRREADDGVVEFPLGDGQMMYARDTGHGFAVFGEEAHDVRNFDASGEQSDAHEKMLGAAGRQIVDFNDVFMYVNLIEFDDQLAQGIAEMEAQAEMVEMMGGAEAAAGFDEAVRAMKTLAADALSFAVGMNYDAETGFSMDMGLQFKEDSQTASYLNNDGDAHRYLGHVPAMDYFFTAAYDFSGDGVQKFMGEYARWVKQMDTTGMFSDADMSLLMTGLEGGVQVMGSSQNMMGGLFNNTIYYVETENPEQYIQEIRKMYASMEESMAQLEQHGVKMDFTMDEQPTEIDGVGAYGYTMAMDMTQMQQGMGQGGPMGQANPAMIMQMVFGATGGPSGYIAEAGDGLIMTMSRDAALFSKAAKAAGGVKTLSGLPTVQKTAAFLPENRIMEVFIGADAVVNNVGPMLMMFGVVPEFEPIDALPPLGMGLTGDDAGMLFRVVLPSETAKAMMDLAPEQGAWDQGGGTDGQNSMDF